MTTYIFQTAINEDDNFWIYLLIIKNGSADHCTNEHEPSTSGSWIFGIDAVIFEKLQIFADKHTYFVSMYVLSSLLAIIILSIDWYRI